MNAPIFWTGRHLQAARKMAGLTQLELAGLANVHINTLKYWERRDGGLNSRAVGKFHDALADNGIDAHVEPDGSGGMVALLRA